MANKAALAGGVDPAGKGADSTAELLRGGAACRPWKLSGGSPKSFARTSPSRCFSKQQGASRRDCKASDAQDLQGDPR